ncbi:MAG: 3-hydroxyacyl-ACP dehydratase FabZ [Betaproteobacteria bacterium]|nr:3-hydroxyacyl-ACP dehydratase FabZ [Betaproteobacteria bacterium]
MNDNSNYSPPLGAAQIMRLLPHRYPLLLVDRVTGWEAGKWLEAHKAVAANEPQFCGHFPGNPLLPGVYMIEALAQASALLGMLSTSSDKPSPLWLLAGVDGARFRRLVAPGDTLDMKVQVQRARRSLWLVSGRAQVNGQLACEATLTCSLQSDG